MTRLNLMLLLAVVLSAFYLVHTQYESRRLYTEIDRAHALARKLESEHEQLQVQKRGQVTSARVQQIASAQLQMRPANPAITEYVTLAGAAPVSGATQVSSGRVIDEAPATAPGVRP
jgi:cell division protein FtsL